MDSPGIIGDWKQLGFWNQLAFGVTSLGTVVTILGLEGANLSISNSLALVFFCSSWILIYANIQQNRKLTKANNELGEAPGKAAQAVEAVYKDSNEKLKKLQTRINNLEIEVANLKYKAVNCQDRLNLVKRERDEANERIKEAKDEARREFQKYFNEYIEFQVGKRHYITSETKITYNQESFETLTELLSPDLRDKSREVWNNISK